MELKQIGEERFVHLTKQEEIEKHTQESDGELMTPTTQNS